MVPVSREAKRPKAMAPIASIKYVLRVGFTFFFFNHALIPVVSM